MPHLAEKIGAFSSHSFADYYRELLASADAAQPYQLWISSCPLPNMSRPQEERARAIRITEIVRITTSEGIAMPLDTHTPQQPGALTITSCEWPITHPAEMQILQNTRTTASHRKPPGNGAVTYRQLTPISVSERFGELADTMQQLATITEGLAGWCQKKSAEGHANGRKAELGKAVGTLVLQSLLLSDYRTPPSRFIRALNFKSWQQNAENGIGALLGAVIAQQQQEPKGVHKIHYSSDTAVRAAVALSDHNILQSDFWIDHGIDQGLALVSDEFLRAFHAKVCQPNTTIRITTKNWTRSLHSYIQSLLLLYAQDTTRNQPEVSKLYQLFQKSISSPSSQKLSLSSLIQQAKERRKEIYNPSARPANYRAQNVREYLAPALWDLLTLTRSKESKQTRKHQSETDRLHCEIIKALLKKTTTAAP